jgi:hypothetical protein
MDDLGPSRGILIGFAIVAPFWTAVAAWLWWC